jgi:PIN domain nuclease of toxin-antitoxin system
MVLLDTCTLLWLVADPSKLSDRSKELLSKEDEPLFVSAITAFEIGLKHRKGRLSLPMEADVWYEQALAFHGVGEIQVSGQIAARSTMLPDLHSDPCDRIIVATAQLQDLTVLTPDDHIKAYPDIKVVW